MEAQAPAFSLKRYWFDDIVLTSKGFVPNENIRVDFGPKCIFSKSSHSAILEVTFTASTGSAEKPFFSVKCCGEYVFEKSVKTVSDIPDFFYANGIAIIYPYLRAYVSLVSQQANFGCAIILPLSNLSGIKDFVKKNTTEID